MLTVHSNRRISIRKTARLIIYVNWIVRRTAKGFNVTIRLTLNGNHIARVYSINCSRSDTRAEIIAARCPGKCCGCSGGNTTACTIINIYRTGTRRVSIGPNYQITITIPIYVADCNGNAEMLSAGWP